MFTHNLLCPSDGGGATGGSKARKSYHSAGGKAGKHSKGKGKGKNSSPSAKQGKRQYPR